jgi:hypothetical protein
MMNFAVKISSSDTVPKSSYDVLIENQPDGIAQSVNRILVTRNWKHFEKVTALTLEDWTKPWPNVK